MFKENGGFFRKTKALMRAEKEEKDFSRQPHEDIDRRPFPR